MVLLPKQHVQMFCVPPTIFHNVIQRLVMLKIKLYIINLHTIINFEKASALWNFYCSRINTFILCISKYINTIETNVSVFIDS